MRAPICNRLIASVKLTDKQYDIRDTKLLGFLIRVTPSGTMNYVCQYKRGKRINIGKVGVLTPIQARDKAKEIIGDYARGIEPKSSSKNGLYKLKTFILNEYRPWVEAHRKTGKETFARLIVQFIPEFGNKFIHELSPLQVERWRTNRLKRGIAAATVNRDVIALKAALSKAVEWKLIEFHPLINLKPIRTDVNSHLRYLTKVEEIALRKALDEREEKIRINRANANRWRNERNYAEFSDFRNQTYVDYIKPMTLISINTGIRRGELLNLKWEHINFSLATLTITGENAKSGKTRHIPMNNEVFMALKNWRNQTAGSNYIFTRDGENRISTFKKSWATVLKIAKIENFRWHDLRHHFASRLVMSGVDLNTVRELLGHSDIKMTLRYAHLAPEHKASAVAKLIAI